MDEYLHPLVVSNPPTPAEDLNTMSLDTTQFEQPQPADSKTLRGRSKSVALGTYAWTLNPPRLPIDYITAPATSSVPYKARSWEPTLETAIKAIVSIKASHVRSFDTETSGKNPSFLFFVYSLFIRWLYCYWIHCRC